MPVETRDRPIPRQWKTSTISGFTGGLNRSLPTNQVAPEELLDALNVYEQDGILKVRTGYLSTNDNAIGSQVQYLYGDPSMIQEFLRASGSVETLAVTTKTVYALRTSAGSTEYWVPLNDNVVTTTANTLASPSTSVTLASGSNLADDDIMVITLDNGDLFAAVITDDSSTPTFVVDRAVPAIAGGNAVYRGVRLTHANTDHVVGVTVPFADSFVFTNNVDAPQVYNGTTCVDVSGIGSAAGDALTKAKTVALFKSQLVFANTEQGGNRYTYRVLRSDIGDITTWTGGSAGFDDIPDSADPIEAMAPLGDANVLYRQRSIILQEFIGSATELYRYRRVTLGSSERTEGLGAVSPRAVYAQAGRHLFVAPTGVFLYRGGVSADSVSRNLGDFFTRRGEVDQSQIDRTFLQYVEEIDALWVFYPTPSDEDGPSKALQLNLSDFTWWPLDLIPNPGAVAWHPNSVLCAGISKSTSVTTIDSLVGTFDEQDWIFDAGQVSPGTPRLLLGVTIDGFSAQQNGIAFLYDFAQPQDFDGVTNRASFNIPFSLTTKDFLDLDRTVRIDWFQWVYTGTDVLVEYSLDRGATWATLGTFTSSAAPEVHREHKQIVTDKIRLRFSGTGVDFRLGELTLKLRDESRWTFS